MAVNAFDPNDPNQNQPGQGSQNSGGNSSSGSGSPNTSSTSPGQGYNVSGSTAAPASGGSAGSNTSSTQGATQSQAGPQNTANPTGTSSGQFTNLQNYLNANQGYNNGQGLAGQINQNLQNQATGIGNQANTAFNNFNTAAGNGYTPYNQSYVNGVLANPSQYTNPPPTSTTTGAPATPTGNYTWNGAQWVDGSGQAAPQGAQQWYSMLNDKYTGPTSMDPNGSLQNQVQQFQQTANMTNNESGREALLASTYGQPGYNQGQQTLDNLFMQSSPSQLSQLQQAQTTANNLNNQVNGDTTQAAATAQTNATTAQQAQQQALAAISGAVGNFGNTYVPGLITQATAAQQAAVQGAQNPGLGGYNAQQLQMLGLTNPASSYYGINPDQYITPSSLSPNSNNVISTQDLANINALGALANGTQTGANAGILAQYGADTGANGAGTWATTNPYGLNSSAFNNAVGNAQTAYNSKANPDNSLISQLQGIQSNGLTQGEYNSAMNPSSALGQTAYGQWLQSGQGGNDSASVAQSLATTQAQLAALNNMYNQGSNPVAIGAPLTGSAAANITPRNGKQ